MVVWTKAVAIETEINEFKCILDIEAIGFDGWGIGCRKDGIEDHFRAIKFKGFCFKEKTEVVR